MSTGQAKKNHQLAKEARVLAVLGTQSDDPANWLSAGQALARLLLEGAAQDLDAAYLNQPVQVANLRSQLASAIGCSGCPHILMRFGYGPETPLSPRRSVDEVLLT